MTPEHPPLTLLRKTATRRIIRALAHESFQFTERKGSQRVYRHADRRRVVIHYHTGNRPLTSVEIRNLLLGTRWTEDDLMRLGLLG